jgi:hypothetical protein
MNTEEKKYQKNFCDKYFGKTTWDQEVLNHVDVLLKGQHGEKLLYIEFKYRVTGEAQHRRALAQAILTNKKQEHILDKVGLAFMDADGHDVLEVIDCSEDTVMYNNDINWSAETASDPSQDAVDRINDRIRGRVTVYRDDDIHALYASLRKGRGTEIQITLKNFGVVYNEWKNTIHFEREEKDEQELINLFLVDILDGTKYEEAVKDSMSDATPNLFSGQWTESSPRGFMHEGTNLGKYELEKCCRKVRIVWDNYIIHAVKDKEGYEQFWRRYHRPPELHEYEQILEHSAELYTDRYRRDTGGEYTPSCFVTLQNQLLAKHYNMDDFIVCDPCAGVGNLENQFGKEYKPYCYLSTLERTDVDICRIKGFDNAVQYNYLKDSNQPWWKYRGRMSSINEIARAEGRRLMVIMNPPYTRKAGHKLDLAIEFFNKVLCMHPDVIVYYCKTEFFLRSTIDSFVKSGYRVQEHVFSNAKDTFKLSEWPVSLVIFDRNEGRVITGETVTADRYELDKKAGKLNFVKTYTYDNKRPDLIKEIEKQIKLNMKGMVLGQYCYLNSVLKISNGGKEKASKITTHNLKWCLLSKGLNFNTHHHYFEWNYLVYRGTVDEIPEELFSDAIMFSQFYKGILFSNKMTDGEGNCIRNYIMPFTAEELGCSRNDLNVLFPERDNDIFAENAEKPFDFREFMAQFAYSAEARALYEAALQVFRYYHYSGRYAERDWNDSFYDVANAVMGKDVKTFQELDKADDHRISRTKTTKGTHGFGRNNLKGVVPDDSLPVFYDFFDKRDALAEKINQELLDAHLLLWKRENIF